MEKINVAINCLKKNWKVGIKYFLFSICCALLTEYVIILDFSGLMAANRNTIAEQRLSIQEAYLENSDIEKGKIVSIQDDPKILFDNIDSYVNTLQICYDDLSSSFLDVQIFISDEGGDYSEENSITTRALQNKGVLNIPINQQVNSLRIDFGKMQNDSYRIKEIILNPTAFTFIKNTVFDMSLERVVIYSFFFGILLCVAIDYKRFTNYLFCYRWQISIVLILLCTIGKLHGSSIGMIPKLLGGEDVSTLWGEPRSILSDEFIVFTGRALGQIESGFQWFSDLIGYSSQDMYLIYGQPVYDIAAIFRPFSVGFLFLGAEYGLAFYWSSRIIIGFLVSFEFGRIITRDDKILALSYAFLVIFSPLLQWWCAINEIIEILLFGQLALILLYLYFQEHSIKKKCLLMAGLVLSAGTYILVLYPARMIPFFYVFLGCAIALTIENKKYIHIKISDIIIWISGIVVLGINLIHVFLNSASTLPILMNTVSPGKRMYSGGPIDNIIELFRGWSSYIWTFVETNNPCEEVGFINFYPLGLILSFTIIFKQKRRDIWLICLNVVNLFLTIYLLFELPEIIGTISLLSRATERIYDAIGFLNLLLLIRVCVLMEKKTCKSSMKILIPISVIFGAISLQGSKGLISTTVSMMIIILVIVLTAIIVNIGKRKVKQVFVAVTILLSIIGGMLVNPINSGLNTIYDCQLIQQIERVNNEDNGMWVVDSLVLANIPTFVGAKSMNATETYPDVKLWKALGLDNSKELWNRYSHISVEIADDTYLELLSPPDHLLLHVTIEKLKEIGVKYILTYQNLDESENVEKISSVMSRTIYKIR